MTARRPATRKPLLVASVGVASVSFACSSSSERYGTFTSGNLVAVPVEAGAFEPSSLDAGSPPSPSPPPPDAGSQSARP